MDKFNIDIGSECPFDAVLLGAGFSRAASGNFAPLMSGFFDLLNAQYPHLDKFLSHHYGDPKTVNVEKAMILMEQITSSPSAATEFWASDSRLHVPQIRSELLAYTLFRLSKYGPLKGHWPWRLLHWNKDETSVITMNYDNLAETILCKRPGVRHRYNNSDEDVTCHHCRMRLLLIHCCGTCDTVIGLDENEWRGTLLKLHGWDMVKSCG